MKAFIGMALAVAIGVVLASFLQKWFNKSATS